MNWISEEFLRHYGTWVLVATGVYFVLSVQSSILATILNVVLLLRKAMVLPRWLKAFAKTLKNLHATLFVISVLALVLFIADVVSSKGRTLSKNVDAVVLIMEFVGLIVLPSLIAMLLWEFIVKRKAAGDSAG